MSLSILLITRRRTPSHRPLCLVIPARRPSLSIFSLPFFLRYYTRTFKPFAPPAVLICHLASCYVLLCTLPSVRAPCVLFSPSFRVKRLLSSPSFRLRCSSPFLYLRVSSESPSPAVLVPRPLLLSALSSARVPGPPPLWQAQFLSLPRPLFASPPLVSAYRSRILLVALSSRLLVVVCATWFSLVLPSLPLPLKLPSFFSSFRAVFRSACLFLAALVSLFACSSTVALTFA